MSNERQRREAAQSEEHEVLPGGSEVAPRSIPRHFDSDRRQRSVMISFRLNIKELEAIESAARARDMTLSSYLRECAMKTAAQPVVKLTNTIGMVSS